MTKAENLAFLKEKLTHSRIIKMSYFTYKEWSKSRSSILFELQRKFKSKLVIVRSSAIGEDSVKTSMAGQYLSVLNIKASCYKSLEESIDAVFQSYQNNKKEDHQVLVQTMVDNVILSGVAFTKDQKTGAPYTIISYDDSGKTDNITSGRIISKNLRVWNGTPDTEIMSEPIRRTYRAIQEIREVAALDALDIEFAVDKNLIVWTLQVRPLILEKSMTLKSIKNQDQLIGQFCDTLTQISRPSDNIFGSKTLLSDMSDWNPAEMIGTSPLPLSYSLYQTLITDNVWSEARAGMGYYNMNGHNLMEEIAGHPFIDTRKSFNSFLPGGVDAITGERLVNAWILRLEKNPFLYDKIEFEIVPTCYTPSFDRKFQEYYSNVLTDEQYINYKNILRSLTNCCVTGQVKYNLNRCELEAKRLESIQDKRTLQDLLKGTVEEISQHIRGMLKECCELGTRPFSAAARHAFIAEAILRGFHHEGFVSKEVITSFKSSFSTISNEVIHGISLTGKDGHKQDFSFKKFGHIRPSSYDILSPRYDQMDQKDFVNLSIPTKENTNSFQLSMMSGLETVLKRLGYEFSINTFIDYYIKSVQLRESIKFTFTRNLSDILECVASIGEKYGIDRSQISYVPIKDFLRVVKEDNARAELLRIIRKNKQVRDLYASIYVNHLVGESRDMHVIPVQESIPNFITNKRIAASSVAITDDRSIRDDLCGKIICIERADPGFDWLFGCQIGGLVTKYGGANSHMAVRCSEFSIPAAIGCGELIYDKMSTSMKVDLDCEAEKIQSI